MTALSIGIRHSVTLCYISAPGTISGGRKRWLDRPRHCCAQSTRNQAGWRRKRRQYLVFPGLSPFPCFSRSSRIRFIRSSEIAGEKANMATVDRPPRLNVKESRGFLRSLDIISLLAQIAIRATATEDIRFEMGETSPKPATVVVDQDRSTGPAGNAGSPGFSRPGWVGSRVRL